MFLGPLCVLLGEVSVQVLCPFINRVFCLPGIESCEFSDKPLSEVSLTNMFCHMVGSLFILLMFSLAMQQLFSLMKSHLFILSFMFFALGVILVKILLHGVPETFLPMFSSRTYGIATYISVFYPP